MNPFEKLPWLPYAIGGVTLSTLLVVFRGALGLSLMLVLLILLVLALVVAIVVLIRQLQQSQAAEAIEDSIASQADADIEKSTPGQLAEMEKLKEELLAAIDALKKSGKKGGEDALARLPWYMVIGPAQAGKSELIRRSGLSFPLTDGADNPRAVRGVGGTRGFSWWLAHEGVLLDMAGRTLATAAFDDSGDWVAFLQTLRRQRPEKPINGVIVVVAVDQIADQPEARIDSVARATRERLEELVHNLGVVFPVYVVFNRCDHVAGFAEFFEDMPAEERKAAWGATLSVERARANAAESLFDEEMGVLLAALSERRLPRMAAMPEALTRARAFAFPLQLERVRPALRRYLRTLFEAESTEDAPLFRGFYFTAAAQAGEPSDRVLQPAVRTLGLNVRAPEGFGVPRPGSWFVRDVFTEVVFPDAALAGLSQGARDRMRRRDRMLVGSFGAGVLAFTLLFAGLSCGNGALVTRTRRAAVEVAAQPDDAPIVKSLRALDRLRSGVAVIDSLVQKKPLWRRLGGYSGDRLDQPALELWAGQTVKVLVAPALRQMEIELRQLTDGNTGDFLHYYKLFRAWRLLSEPDQITVYDAELLAAEVQRVQQDQMSIGSATEDERREFPELVSRQMAFLAAHPEALKKVAHSYYRQADPVLTQRAAQRIRATWDAKKFYADMIQRAGLRLPHETFASLVGGNMWLQGSVDVPGAFTKAGWQKEIQPRIEDYRALMKRDRVLLDIYEQRPPDLANDLLGLYATDYSQHWAAFMNGVGLTGNLRGLPNVANMLEDIRGDKSPLFKLMRRVRTETQLGAAQGTPLVHVESDFVLLGRFFEARGDVGSGDQPEGDKGFMGWAQSKWQAVTHGKGASDVTNRYESQNVLYAKLLEAAQAEVKDAAGSGGDLAVIAGLISSGGDKGKALRGLAEFGPRFCSEYTTAAGAAPTERLLGLPVLGTRATVIKTSVAPAMAGNWSQMVVQPFQQTLAGKYPFAASGSDASIADFTAVFGPNGAIWKYYQANLVNFINEDGTPKAGGAPVPGEMVAFYRKAYEIRQAFFTLPDQAGVSFVASTTVPRIEGHFVNVGWVAFDCGGEHSTYTNGASQDYQLQWPGADPTAGAGLRVNARTQVDPSDRKSVPQPIMIDPILGEGPWGLFRLLDRAASVTDMGNEARATWVVPAGSSKLYVTWTLRAPSAHNPFRRGFLRLAPPAVH